ncbi:hypothetical protein [Mycobacterium sp.]|uniref:hypothetical protein n=1 Tax=Mycobacterium sp. TaxID=1785 RepID=UPI003F9CE87D
MRRRSSSSSYHQIKARGLDPGESTPERFALWIWRQGEAAGQHYDIGCPDAPDHGAMAYGVTALRHLCAVEPEAAVELLRMAVAEIESVHQLKQARS